MLRVAVMGGLALGVLLAGGAGAHADGLGGVVSAKEHYQRGTQLYDLQRFEEAAQEYELAYQLKSDPALLYNIGQANRLAKNWAKAEGAFRAYLRNVPRAPNRAKVEELIIEIGVAAAEEKRLAAEKAKRDAEAKAAEEKRLAEEQERQRAIAEAQARAEEARTRGHHADPVAAARARKLKLAGIGLAGGGGLLLVSGGGLLGAAGAIASRYNDAAPDTQFNPSDESRWRAERTAGIALLAVGGVAAIAGTALAVVSARKQHEAMSAMRALPNGASFATAGGWPDAAGR
jgi:tetratricopeptide (TPR) repeat protein